MGAFWLNLCHLISSNTLASSTNAFGLLVAGDPFAGELFLHSPVIIGFSKQ